jgi:hypothetical protein
MLGGGFGQKVEIDAARRILTVGTEPQPAERATAFTVILGRRPLPRAAAFRFAVPGVPLCFTPGSMLSPAAAG